MFIFSFTLKFLAIKAVFSTNRPQIMWVFDAGLGKDDVRQSFLDMKIDNPTQPLKSFGICVRLLLDDLFPQCVFEKPVLSSYFWMEIEIMVVFVCMMIFDTISFNFQRIIT
jgi:hypothetical protein